MFSKILAACGLLICLALALRMVLKPALRRRLDQQALRLFVWLRDAFFSLTSWRRRAGLKKAAETEAAAAIARARKPEGEWEGNVYRPKSFGKSDKNRNNKLH